MLESCFPFGGRGWEVFLCVGVIERGNILRADAAPV